MNVKTYGQDCMNDFECNTTLTCNRPNASYCDCPFTSTSFMCDCNPGFEYFSQKDRSCSKYEFNDLTF